LVIERLFNRIGDVAQSGLRPSEIKVNHVNTAWLLWRHVTHRLAVKSWLKL